MQALKFNVGIDISKDNFVATIATINTSFEVDYVATGKFDNTNSGFEQFYQWVEKNSPEDLERHFTMEATGIYYENLAYFLRKKTPNVYVLLPVVAKRYFESLNTKTKTDKIDAKQLARLGLERKLEAWVAYSDLYLRMRRLTREHEQLQKQKTMASNQLHALKHSHKPDKKSIARYELLIATIEELINEVKEEMNVLYQEEPEVKERIKKIMSIPGVGLITAMTVIAETNGFANFTSAKQVVSYAGLDVRVRESGKYKGQARITKKGNTHIRRVLYMPAISHKTHSPKGAQFYERISQRKSSNLIAITALERKLLILIYALWKKNEYYDPNYKG